MSRPDLEQQIITSEEAKAFLQMVTKGFYSQSYTGLWIYEAIGREWDELRAWSNGLKDEINPQTCTWSVAIWEWVVGIETDESLSLEYRRQRILTKLNSVRSINPETIRRGVAALIGASADAVEVNDLVGPYRFEVIIHPQGTPFPYNRITPYVREIKPSHLSFDATVETKVEIRVLIQTEWHQIGYGLTGQYNAGTKPNTNVKARLIDITVGTEIGGVGAAIVAQNAGTTFTAAQGTNTQHMPTPSTLFRQEHVEIDAQVAAAGYKTAAQLTAESGSETGRHPAVQYLGRAEDISVAAEVGAAGYAFRADAAGTNPQEAVQLRLESVEIGAEVEAQGYTVPYAPTGTQPDTQVTLGSSSGGIVPVITAESYTIKYTMCGTQVTKSDE